MTKPSPELILTNQKLSFCIKSRLGVGYCFALFLNNYFHKKHRERKQICIYMP